MDKILAAPVNFWRWLNSKDPRPGLNKDKIIRLLVKAFLFAMVINFIVVGLAALKVPYMNTFWGQTLVMLLVYIPFLRWFMIDMTPAPARAKVAANTKDGKKFKKTDKKRKFAGVKGKGPRLR